MAGDNFANSIRGHWYSFGAICKEGEVYKGSGSLGQASLYYILFVTYLFKGHEKLIKNPK